MRWRTRAEEQDRRPLRTNSEPERTERTTTPPAGSDVAGKASPERTGRLPNACTPTSSPEPGTEYWLP